MNVGSTCTYLYNTNVIKNKNTLTAARAYYYIIYKIVGR